MVELLGIEKYYEVKETFALFDKNGTGHIRTTSVGDLLTYLAYIPTVYNPTQRELQEMINAVDVDRSGKISLQEIMTIVAELPELPERLEPEDTNSDYLRDACPSQTSTDFSWKALARTRWVADDGKQYYLEWDGGLLYAKIDHERWIPLPSIQGGLRWGTGGARDKPPTFTLAFGDVEHDRLTWRTFKGRPSHVWSLRESDVDFEGSPLTAERQMKRVLRPEQPEARRLPEQEGYSRRPPQQEGYQQRQGPPRSAQQQQGLKQSSHQSQEGMQNLLTTDEEYRFLHGTTWLESQPVGGKSKRYDLTWKDNALYVQFHGKEFPLPSIDGGLRWGAPGRGNLPPKFTLADQDVEEHKLTWRKPDGSIANTWFLEER
jgi:hypothetical protein